MVRTVMSTVLCAENCSLLAEGKETFSPPQPSLLLKAASSTRKNRMPEEKKRLTTLNMAFLAWLLAGVALWVFFVPAPVESFILDNNLGIDEVPDSQALQGASPPFWPLATGVDSRNTLLLRSAKPHPFLTAGDLPAGAIFRLKLVRLHPPVGPPSRLPC